MSRIVFQSLYADPDLTSLKHALLYFGRLKIPRDSWFYTLPNPEPGLGEDEAYTKGHSEYVMMPAEHAYGHLEALEREGLIEFVSPHSGRPSAVAPIELADGIAAELSRAIGHGLVHGYESADLQAVLEYLKLDRGTPGAMEAVGAVTAFLAALALQPVAMGGGLPCTDDRVIFDLMNFGTKQIFERAVKMAVLTPPEVQAIKANIIGQEILSLYLPSFRLKSFDDVMDMRRRLKDPIGRFAERVERLAYEIEARPWDPEFRGEVGALIEETVKTEVEDLRKAATAVPARVATAIVSGAAGVTLKSFFPTLIADWAIGGGAVSLLDALKREHERAKKARLESSFSLLLQV